MSAREHPVRLLLEWLACGGELTDADLAELPLSANVDRDAVEGRVRAAASEIGERRRCGESLPRIGVFVRDAVDEIIGGAGSPERQASHRGRERRLAPRRSRRARPPVSA